MSGAKADHSCSWLFLGVCLSLGAMGWLIEAATIWLPEPLEIPKAPGDIGTLFFSPHICFSFHLRALQLIRPQLSHSEYLDRSLLTQEQSHRWPWILISNCRKRGNNYPMVFSMVVHSIWDFRNMRCTLATCFLLLFFFLSMPDNCF